MCSKGSFEEEPINKANLKGMEVKEEEKVKTMHELVSDLNP